MAVARGLVGGRGDEKGSLMDYESWMGVLLIVLAVMVAILTWRAFK